MWGLPQLNDAQTVHSSMISIRIRGLLEYVVCIRVWRFPDGREPEPALVGEKGCGSESVIRERRAAQVPI
jgi:hypothetical protein